MGNSEAATPTKSDKASSPVQQEQPAIHPYHDWASMQAYYGPGVAVPPPYLAAAVASGHAPHPYMWGPQPFMPPYGTPYTAIYTHGVYSHPSVSLSQGSHSHGQGIAPSTSTNEAIVMATPLNMVPLAKSSSNKGRGLLKKLKGLDGLPVSIGNGNPENTSGGAVHGLSQSGESGAEGSSDGSDGNTEPGENKAHRRGSSEDTPNSENDGKATTLENAVYGGETNGSSNMSLEVSIAPANVTGKPAGTEPSSSPTPGRESRFSGNEELQATPVHPATKKISMGRDGAPTEHRIQDERAVKRERRKQSNRESARRSRLRKQAETEELALKVETLGAENTTLRTEIVRLREDSDKLRLENSALMEKLKDAQLSQEEESSPEKVEGLPSVTTENFLSRVNNPNSFGVSGKQEREAHGNSSAKLHQLLGPSSRSDAVAAG